MLINAKIGIILYIILMLLSTVLIMALLNNAKKTNVLYSLIACHIAIFLWYFFGIIEIFSRYTFYYEYAVRCTMLPIMFLGSLFMLFTVNYIGAVNKKNKKYIWLLFLPTALCYIPMLTNKYLFLVIYSMVRTRRITQWGILFYINTAISYLYFIISGVLIIYKSMKYKTKIKGNLALVLSVMFPASLNVLTGTKVIKSPGFDMVPVSFSIFLAVLSLLVFKYKIIDIVSIAYNELFNYINSAALIIDRDGNIDEYNSTFYDYFSRLINPIIGVNIQVFLDILDENTDEKSNIKKIREAVYSDDKTVYEGTIRVFSVDSSFEQYTISVVALRKVKRNVVGKLILMKDVTAYRSITLSKERNRLSSDLHDSLGNCINIISSNLEYVVKNYTGPSDILECINISYEKSTSAFLHLRRIVEELKPIDIENNGLLWALQSMFYRLRMKAIHIEFFYNNIDDSFLSKHKHGEAIYYICQEAINNSAIHGKATGIVISLVQVDNQIKLYISDDGVGCSSIVKSNGLQSMESRINTLGGKLEYGSPSEGGFNLRAIIPLEDDAAEENSFWEVENDQSCNC